MIRSSLKGLLALVALAAAPLHAQEKPSAIWVMKANGSEARKLVDVEGYTEQAAARWSRDGKQILFDAMDPNSRARELFVVNADGSGLHKLGPGQQADWSPDGKQIVSDDGREAFVQNVDGQGRDRITTGRSPRWSPDGSQIAVVEDRNLFVVDMVTNERRALFAEPFSLLYARSLLVAGWEGYRAGLSSRGRTAPPVADRQLARRRAGRAAPDTNGRRNVQHAVLFAGWQETRLLGRLSDLDRGRRRQRTAEDAAGSERSELRARLVARWEMDRVHERSGAVATPGAHSSGVPLRRVVVPSWYNKTAERTTTTRRHDDTTKSYSLTAGQP